MNYQLLNSIAQTTNIANKELENINKKITQSTNPYLYNLLFN